MRSILRHQYATDKNDSMNGMEGAELFCVASAKIAAVKAHKNSSIYTLLGALKDIDFISHMGYMRGKVDGLADGLSRIKQVL